MLLIKIATYEVVVTSAAHQHMHAFHLRDSFHSGTPRGQGFIPSFPRPSRIDARTYSSQSGGYQVPPVSRPGG